MKHNNTNCKIFRVFLTVLFLMFGGMNGAWAQPIGNHDYAGLFEEYADEVITFPENETEEVLQVLEMPGSIHIRRTENSNGVEFEAIDQSEGGAVMCLFANLSVLQRRLDNCENVGTPEHDRTNEEVIDRLGVFIAGNSYPSYTIEEFRERWRVQREENRQAPQQCPEFEADIDKFYWVILSDEFPILMDLILEEARLPVMNPCIMIF